MEGKVFIYRGKRSVLSRILASVFFACFICSFYRYFLNLYYSISSGYFGNIYTTLMIAIVLFVFGFSFSFSSHHEFDFDKNKYREYITIGPIGYGFWEDFKKLKRVSTYFNSSGYYEVNILDISNRKYNTLAFKNEDDAVNYGRDLAKTLDIYFLERN